MNFRPRIAFLVGAGPADPTLLTLRGKSLLELANVVVYDSLASKKLLGYCPQAELIYVGKSAGDHALSQDQINELPRAVTDAEISSPAVTFIGRVVKLRDTIGWFEKRPLFGQNIAVTRTRLQASELSFQLEELGANVIEAPTIERVPTSATIPEEEFDWVVFLSAGGALATRDRLREVQRDARIFARARIAAIGDATSRAVAEALADEFAARNEIAGKRFLLLRADIGQPVLRERLEVGHAHTVRHMAIYETRIAPAPPGELVDAIDSGTLHWITITSSSTAENFFKVLPHESRTQFKSVAVASIGPVTSKTLRELGLEPAVEAATCNIAGLVRAIAEAGR